jgi:hypothetical protein
MVLDVVCNPAHPNPDAAFTVTYTVQNEGESASAPRRDAVRIFAQDGTTVVSEKSVDGKPLARSAQEQLTATFEEGVTDGLHYPQVLVNLDGAPYGAAANEHGSQTYANGPSLEVGVYLEQVGPVTAGQAYYTEIRTATEALNNATQYKDAQSLPYVQRGLTAIGTALAAGAADFASFAGLSDIATSITTLAEQAGYAYAEALQQKWPPDMPELIVALYTAVVPLEALTYDGSTLQRYLPPLQERVVAVVQGLHNAG